MINLDPAKKSGRRSGGGGAHNNWPVAIAIVDNHGFLVYYEKLDDTQTAGPAIARKLLMSQHAHGQRDR